MYTDLRLTSINDGNLYNSAHVNQFYIAKMMCFILRMTLTMFKHGLVTLTGNIRSHKLVMVIFAIFIHYLTTTCEFDD